MDQIGGEGPPPTIGSAVAKPNPFGRVLLWRIVRAFGEWTYFGERRYENETRCLNPGRFLARDRGDRSGLCSGRSSAGRRFQSRHHIERLQHGSQKWDGGGG